MSTFLGFVDDTAPGKRTRRIVVVNKRSGDPLGEICWYPRCGGRAVTDELRLMGVAEVAAVLGTSKEQVRGWFASGELPSLEVGAGREPRINLEMLRAWLRHRATAEADRFRAHAIRAPRRHRAS